MIPREMIVWLSVGGDRTWLARRRTRSGPPRTGRAMSADVVVGKPNQAPRLDRSLLEEMIESLADALMRAAVRGGPCMPFVIGLRWGMPVSRFPVPGCF